MTCLFRYISLINIISLGLISLFIGSALHASSQTTNIQPETLNVAFLPTEHVAKLIQPDFKLENAQIIGQDETGFFLEELKEMGQLCDLKMVSCLSSVGKLLGADLIIQIWTDPEKNDVFRFIDIGLEQEIHRQLISKEMTDEKLMKLIEDNFADLYAPQIQSTHPQVVKKSETFQKSIQISQQISPSAPPLTKISGWSAIGVGSLSSIVGSLFYFAHPAHYLTTPSDASRAQQTQIQNEQQDKKNIAYTLWTSGTVLTMAGIVHLVHEDVNE
jgi:hypothetical protein